MPALQTIEVIIGLLFLYLITVIVFTVLVDIISTFLRLRNYGLKAGIHDLLKGNDEKGDFLSKTKFKLRYFFRNPFHDNIDIKNDRFVKKFFDSYLIQSLGPLDHITEIPSKTFVLALYSAMGVELKSYNDFLDIKNSNERVKTQLKALVTPAAGEFDAAFKNIEEWYNNTEEIYYRHWYRGKVRTISFIMALLLTTLLNLDSIMISQELWVNSINAKILEAGTSFFKHDSTKSIDAQEFRKAWEYMELSIKRIYNCNHLIGWELCSQQQDSPRALPQTAQDGIEKIIGLLMTSLAIALGANYWFDIIVKLLKANKGS